jgi:alpha-N-arabinofuranosidase
MDEWNYWHRKYTYGELGCVYDLRDGLGIAAGLHEFYRNTDLVKVATYAQTVNVIGAIKTSRIAAELETTGLVLALYRAHYGEIPLVITDDFGPVDVSAALSKEGKTLTVGVVNPTDGELLLTLLINGATPASTATRWHVAGPDGFTHNTPGKPRVVDIQQTDNLSTAVPLPIPPLGAAVFAVPLK